MRENIEVVASMIRVLGPEVHVVGLCQGALTALSATALLSSINPGEAPRSLTLIAGPIEPLINPTRALFASRAHGPDWVERNAIRMVPAGFAGQGRRVYPADAQMRILTGYLARQPMFGEIFCKLWNDDGEDPVRFPFVELITSLMNLTAELVLDTVQQIFIDRALIAGTLTAAEQVIKPSEIRRTALMTIEGEGDDIAPPGQTYAAHALCAEIPGELRAHLLVPGSGHFSLFHGSRWRSTVLPALLQFFSGAEAASRRISISNGRNAGSSRSGCARSMRMAGGAQPRRLHRRSA
jgi:poly(3-hydroxybutyrate) depolymerase